MPDPLTAARLDQALELARLGWAVFPCHPVGTEREKQPRTPRGFHDATTDESAVRSWWERWPDSLVGIEPGRHGLAVLDVDRHPGKPDGFASLDEVGLLADAAVQGMSVSGRGVHLWYRAAVRSRNGQLPGVDLKSQGGYVIAPYGLPAPSEIVEPLPDLTGRREPRPEDQAGAEDWLLNAPWPDYDNGPPEEESEAEWIASLELEVFGRGTAPRTWASAAEFLKWVEERDGGAEPGAKALGAVADRVSGWNGHDAMLRVQDGLVHSAAEGHPGIPWALEELRAAWLATPHASGDPAASWAVALEGAVRRWAPLAAGSAPAAAPGAPVADDAAFRAAVEEAKRRRRVDATARREILAEDGGFGVFSPADVVPSLDFVATDDPAPLVDGVLGRGELAMLFAPAYAGKSFAAMGLAHAIAHGAEWAGLPAERGRALYLLLEGDATWRARSRAWHAHAGLVPGPGVDVLAKSLSLLDPATVSALADHVREVGYDLVIVDTLSRSIAGAPEEATEEMSAYVGHLAQLREATGDGSVLVLHHAKKEQRETYRGSTVLGAAMDRILCLTMDDAKATRRRLVTQKSKASQLPDDLLLDFVQVDGSGSAVLEAGASQTLLDALANALHSGRKYTRAELKHEAVALGLYRDDKSANTQIGKRITRGQIVEVDGYLTLPDRS